MLPDEDKLARRDKETVLATALLPLLPATAAELIRKVRERYGLTPPDTLSLLYELRRDQQVTQTSQGVYVPVKIEK